MPFLDWNGQGSNEGEGDLSSMGMTGKHQIEGVARKVMDAVGIVRQKDRGG